MKTRLEICFFCGMIGFVLLYFYMGTDIFRGVIVVIVGLLIVIMLLYIRRIIKGNRVSLFLEELRAKKREMLVDATVTKVENMIWKYSQVEDATLECEYTDHMGKLHVFKASGIIGKFKVKIGDTVQVVVEPNKWSNYQILLKDIVD